MFGMTANSATEVPDLAHFFAIHAQMRADTRRFVAALDRCSERDRIRRGRPLAVWAKGFAANSTSTTPSRTPSCSPTSR